MANAAKTRIYLAIIAVLVVIIAAMGYKFIVAGSVEKADDGRLAVKLEPPERALMLREMREFVVGLQAVAEGCRGRSAWAPRLWGLVGCGWATRKLTEMS